MSRRETQPVTYRPTEREITAVILDYLRVIGAVAWKNHGHLGEKPGRLDIDAAYKGYFIAIETKGAKGKLTIPQQVEVEKIREAGSLAVVAYKLEDVMLIIDQIDFHLKSIRRSGER